MNASGFVVVRALTEVFARRAYVIVAGAYFIASLALFFFLPILLIPGNSVGLQASLYEVPSWIALFALAALMGVLLAMNTFIIMRTLSWKKRQAGTVATSIASTFVASMFSLKACPMCLAVILGFLGFPVVLGLLKYHLELSFLALAITGASIYFLSKSIVEHCEACKV